MPDGRYRLQAANGLVVEVDAVVLVVPAAIAADLIRPLSTNAANLLGRVRYASVGTAVVAYPRAAVRQIRALTRTGLLVPSSRGRLLKAATFFSAKWPHLADPTHVLVRLSGGSAGAREICDLDDAALAARLHSDLPHLELRHRVGPALYVGLGWLRGHTGRVHPSIGWRRFVRTLGATRD